MKSRPLQVESYIFQGGECERMRTFTTTAQAENLDCYRKSQITAHGGNSAQLTYVVLQECYTHVTDM